MEINFSQSNRQKVKDGFFSICQRLKKERKIKEKEDKKEKKNALSATFIFVLKLVQMDKLILLIIKIATNRTCFAGQAVNR